MKGAVEITNGAVHGLMESGVALDNDDQVRVCKETREDRRIGG